MYIYVYICDYSTLPIHIIPCASRKCITPVCCITKYEKSFRSFKVDLNDFHAQFSKATFKTSRMRLEIV